ncbi:MAG: MotA/TolQ/ExbB proton channel family protein [Bacteroidales bacterium]|nr:MotA/TolQ/ExbB proton channel family protein [Bacteroidales bacterium]MBR0501334.1 MotA/TolQ/ExbB proton channel family protein [Bacteroidales bacterium]
MFKFFVEGGWAFMTVLTVLLAAIFFAAWKAPRWVKEIGSFALAFGFFGTILGLMQMFDVLSRGPVPQEVICAGLKVNLITLIYGIIIYLVSLVVRVIQKPRL